MAQIFVHVFLMIVLVRMSMHKDRPWLYAAIYAIVWFALGLLFSAGNPWSILIVLITALGAFFAAALFFWSLSRLDHALLWWLVALVGNVCVLILGGVVAFALSAFLDGSS